MRYITENQNYRCWEETYLGFVKVILHQDKATGELVVDKINVTRAFKLAFNFKRKINRIYKRLNNTK